MVRVSPFCLIIKLKSRYSTGKEAAYNDVPSWQWQQLLSTLGAKEGQSKSYSIKTPTELQDLLGHEEFQSAKVLQLVEVHMDAQDAPRALQLQAALVRDLLLEPM